MTTEGGRRTTTGEGFGLPTTTVGARSNIFFWSKSIFRPKIPMKTDLSSYMGLEFFFEIGKKNADLTDRKSVV